MADLPGDAVQPALRFLEFAVEIDRSTPRPWSNEFIENALRMGRSLVGDDEVWTGGDVQRRRMPEPFTIDGWPRLMRVEHAAAYCGEKSVSTFRRAVGTLYPHPIKVRGKGWRWLRETLDQAIDRLRGEDDKRPLSERL